MYIDVSLLNHLVFFGGILAFFFHFSFFKNVDNVIFEFIGVNWRQEIRRSDNFARLMLPMLVDHVSLVLEKVQQYSRNFEELLVQH